MLSFILHVLIFFSFVNRHDEKISNDMFNVPEVESPMIKRILPKTSTPKKGLNIKDKKTVQIHTLTSKVPKTKLIGKYMVTI